MKKNALFFVALFSVSAFCFGQKSDSLKGFDRNACYQLAAHEHITGAKADEFVNRRERIFINAKYHINQASALKAGLPIPSILTSSCNNTDFESGNFTGWVGAVGYNTNSSGPLTILTNGISTLGINAAENSCSYHTIVTSLSGNDPYSGLPMLDPLGGSFACRLGGENENIQANNPCTTGNPTGGGNTGAGGEVLQQTFMVTPSNDLFTYKYSVVMNAAFPNHSSGQQPYFRVEVMDSVGNKIPCQQFYVEGDTTGIRPKGFLLSNKFDNNGDSVFYLPWTANAINLSTLLGKKVTIRFSAAGCTFSAHFCYAYIDASCGPVTLTNITGSHAVCAGANDTLVAPNSGGGNYQWTHVGATPPTLGIVGSNTNQTVVVNQPGTYEVLITYPNGCNYKIDTTLTFNALPGITITTNGSLCNGANNATATVTPSGSTNPYTYSWSPTPGSGQGTPTVSGLNAPATYTVKVTGGTGCSATKTVTTTQPTAIAVTNTVTNVSCHGGNNGTSTVSASGGTPGYNYSWSPSGGSAPKATGLIAGTYTCTVLDTNGCVFKSVATVTEPAVLAATNIKRDIKCYGDSTGRDTVLATGGTAAYTYSWSPYRGTSSIDTVLVAGNYTCTITDAHGCVTSTSCTIKQQPKLVLATTSIPTPCGGISGSATVTPSGGTGTYTYSWAAPIVTTTSSATIVAAGIYTVTVTDSNGCKKIATIPVSNTGGPRDTLDHKQNVTCFGGNDGNATVHGVGGTGTLTYSWSPAGGGTASPTDTSITNLTAGVYLCTIVDGATCQTTVTDSIFQPAKITATIASVNVSCFGGSNGTATVTATGGNPGTYTYSWTTLPAGATGQGTVTVGGLPIGTYTCTIHDPKGCIGSATITIKQPPLLTASNTVNAVSCFGGNNGSSTVTAAGGSPSYTYSWAPSGGTASTAPALGAGTYTCTVTDSLGCKVTSSAVITQPAQIAATNTPTNVMCNGGNNGAAVVVATGGVQAYTYSWSPSGGANATATGLTAGTYTCLITDAHGCTFNSPVTITQPTALASGNTITNVTCNGLKNGTITAVPSGGTSPYTYSWTPFGTGGGITVSNLGPNTYTCDVTDAHGCSVVFTATITQPAVLSAIIPPVKLACFGGNNAKDSVTVSGGTLAYTYSWSSGGGSSHVITGMSAGNYTCTVTDSKGCTIAPVLTVATPLVISGNPSMTQAICLANSGSITLHPTGGTGTLGSFHYTWSPSGGNGISASGLAVGFYTCTITDSLGCSVQVTDSVTHHNNIIAPNFTTQAAICLSSNGSAVTAPTGGTGPYQYTWSPSGGNTTTASGLLPGTYTCHITDSQGCTTQSTVVVSQGTNPLLNSMFGTNPVKGMVPLAVAFTDSSAGSATTWSWDFGNGTTGSGGTISYTYTTPGIYTVTETITDANGCTATSTVVIDALPLVSVITVPNVFTPNGDGTNDEFKAKTVALATFDMKIFDRWGVLMSDITDPAMGWDGKKSGGAAADSGTYYYVITAKGEDSKSYTLTGFLTLTR